METRIRQSMLAYFIAFVMVFSASFAVAKSAISPSIKTEAELVSAVRANTKELVAKLEANKGLYKKSPEKFFAELERTLGDVVDFRRIAARIMGKYARKATKEQRNRFVEMFKKSLFSAYGKSLADSGNFKIEVLDGKFTAKNKSRAAVALEVTTESGATYPVIYSMHNKPKTGWLMENIIVNGVNVGLAFRDSFEQSYKENKGDLEKVIKGWTADVGSD